MGRLKGSKNKVKTAVVDSLPAVENPAVINQPAPEAKPEPIILGLTHIKKRERQPSLPTCPDWVLTRTLNGTPIAIEGICKVGNTYQFVVIPNYKERTSKTTVDSKGVIKPEFATPEQAKEFENILFGIKSVGTPPETITTSPDTVTEVQDTITTSPETTTLEKKDENLPT